MSSKRSSLIRWGAVTGALAICGIAWSVAGTAPKPSDRAGQPSAALQAEAEETAKLHDEVAYFADVGARAEQGASKQLAGASAPTR